MPRKTDKRNRLVEAAKALIHQQGFNLTTLADIAQEADVPLGNVYYYFKTKEAIGIAVIEKRAQELAQWIASWNESEGPFARLSTFILHALSDIDSIARFGCPIGALCQELGKQGGSLADLAAKLLHDELTWVESQFGALGAGDRSQEFALSLLSSVQGTYLLTHTFKDPKLADRQVKSLMNWLKALPLKATAKEKELALA